VSGYPFFIKAKLKKINSKKNEHGNNVGKHECRRHKGYPEKCGKHCC
jgi:hypothetical protein